MSITRFLIAGGLLAFAAASPASAVTNLIKNGSFEQGSDGFAAWTKINDNIDYPVVAITYGAAAAYPIGAFGEAVSADNAFTPSPDAAGVRGAYFVSDTAQLQTVRQLTYLTPGNYKVGFSAYLPANGAGNPGDATFKGTIVGNTVANFTASSGTAQNWVSYSGVGQIVTAGYYNTDFVFTTLSPGAYGKDVVIDRVYAIATEEVANVVIGAPTVVPEPQTWALMVLGFGLIGVSVRRRKAAVAA